MAAAALPAAAGAAWLGLGMPHGPAATAEAADLLLLWDAAQVAGRSVGWAVSIIVVMLVGPVEL
jgi:hypothetical protein